MKAHRGIATSDSRKKSVYLPADILAELRAEAARRGCTMSALMQEAWKIARAQIVEFGDRSAA